MLPNPDNIHTAAVAVKKFTANSKDNGRYSLAVNSANYWIVVERAVNTGVISLKQTTAGNDATAAGGWALTGNHWKKGTSNSWSEGTTGALQAELRTVPSRRYGIRVVNMELAGPGGDELYTDGEDLRITATLSEAAHIDGTVINLPPHFCDAAGVKEGNGTDRIVFGCRIRGGPHTRVHVEADSVRPGSGGDGPRLSDAHPAVERMTAVHGVTGPGITDVRVNSPGSDGLWTPGERVEVRYTFDAPMTVTTRSGTPVAWVQRVYESGKIYGEAVPFDRIDTNDANTLVFAKTLGGREQTTALAIPANSLYPKHGVIVGTETGAIAVFTHSAYRTAVGAPCGSLPDEIWCAELTVGTNNVATGFGEGLYGDLSPKQFTYSGTDFTISGLFHNAPTLLLSGDPLTGNSIIDRAGFHLYVGNLSVSFPSDLSYGNFRTWRNTDPNWSVGDRVIVRLAGRASDDEVEVEAPTVRLAPSVSPAGSDSRWTEGENGGGDTQLQRNGGGGNEQRKTEPPHCARQRPSAHRRIPSRQRHSGTRVRVHPGRRRRWPHVNGGHGEQLGAERRRNPKCCDERERDARAPPNNREGSRGTKHRRPDRAL